MKCSYCDDGKCERKYSNRFNCRGKKEGICCACKCQMTQEDDALSKISSFALGTASMAGGAIITGVTLGMGAPVGGFLMGAGASLITKPIRKEMDEEHLEFNDSASEAFMFGGAGSVITTLGCSALNPLVATQIPIAVQVGTASFLISQGFKNGFCDNPFQRT